MIKEREAPKDSADRVFRRMSYTYALNIFSLKKNRENELD